MDASLFELAYTKAAAHYEEATLAVLHDLSAAYPAASFDDIHRAGNRAMELHLASLRFAERIWGATFSYEKAEAALISQFSEFPPNVCVAALRAAYARTR